jgi:hypothetical protein
MKKIYTFQKFILLIIVTVAAMSFTSCVTKHAFATSNIVPAAEGSVKVKKDNNNNYAIDMKVIRLADATRLSPARQMYIVWMDAEGNSTQKLGRLESSSSLISKTLKSSFKTVSSYKPTKIFITAEDDANVSYPSSEIVLSTTNF